MVSNLKGLYARPLDFLLQCCYSNHHVCVPFSRHVSQPKSASSATFPQYTLLPTELQLKVLKSCETSTLFQLMHTSRFMRVEAMNLFFSDPESVYLVDGNWLVKGGYYGTPANLKDHLSETYYDPAFMQQVQYITIEFGWDKPIIIDPQAFWSTVQRLFPRLKHVTMSMPDNTLRANILETNKVQAVSLREASEDHPSGIGVSITFVCKAVGKCWDLVTPQTDTMGYETLWEERDYHPDLLITMPYKTSNGRIGEVQEFLIKKIYCSRVGLGAQAVASDSVQSLLTLTQHNGF